MFSVHWRKGLLTDRYLNGVASDSRAAKSDIPFLSEDNVNNTISMVKQLNNIAADRGQTLAQMALAWNLRDTTVTSVLIGASRVEQLENNLKTLDNLNFSSEELNKIDSILKN